MGKFIVFEGPDKSGKTTQLKLLETAFPALFPGRELPVFCRDPGSTELGEELRMMLKTRPMDKFAELTLFSAARCQLNAEVIRPALAAGRDIICDRYWLSTYVYQLRKMHNTVDARQLLREACVGFSWTAPSTTILLLPDKFVESKGEDAMERVPAEEIKRRYDQYAALPKEMGDSIVTVSATGPVYEVFRRVCAFVSNVLTGK